MAYEDIPSFHIADYIVFALSIVLSLGIGIYHGFSGGRQKTTAEYLVGNRKMSIFPVAMSLVVSFESSIMMLGFPAETYLYGFQYCFLAIGWFIASIIGALIFVPMLHKVNMTSVFEYMEKRFNSTNVRLIGNALQTISILLYMGVVLFGPATALEAVTGFPLYASIIVVAVVAMVYTALGGIRAVVWTDLFQCIVMTVGMLALIIKGTSEVGGVGEVFRRNREAGRLDVTFNPDPRIRLSIWSIGFSTIIRYMNVPFNQASFQRISSTPTVSAARRVYLLAAPGFLFFSFLACVEGIVGYAYFDFKGCDPLESGRISNSNQIIILLVLELFQSMPGMAGLFLAALFSASLSTLSSGLGSVSANFWEDIVKPRMKPVSEERATLIAKSAVLVGGVVSVAVSFLTSEVGGSLAEMHSTIQDFLTSVHACASLYLLKVASYAIHLNNRVIPVLIPVGNVINGAVAAPLAGIQLVSALFPSVNSRGAIISAIISFLITCWLSFSKLFYKHLAPSEKLPSAPVDQCLLFNSSSFTNRTFNTTLMTYNIVDTTTAVPQDDSLGYGALFTLSPYWYNPLGVLLCILIALFVSLIIGTKEDDKTEERYLATHIRRIWCCNSFLSRYIKDSDQFDRMIAVKTNMETVSIENHTDSPEKVFRDGHRDKEEYTHL